MKAPKQKTYLLVSSRSVFKISLWVAALTVLGVYFWGLGTHHTFFENSILSTTILSMAFFSFITVGLYHGVKLKDDLGKVIDKFHPQSIGDVSTNLPTVESPIEPIDIGEGIAGIILSILLWILMAVVFAAALWIFGNVLTIIFLVFIAMLYWIFFRALRLVFKNSNKTKGDVLYSIRIGLMYTVLYNFWIYAIFILTEYFKS